LSACLCLCSSDNARRPSSGSGICSCLVMSMLKDRTWQRSHGV
jgi:hypothetical protein